MAQREGHHSSQGLPLPPSGQWGGGADVPNPEQRDCPTHREQEQLGPNSADGMVLRTLYAEQSNRVESFQTWVGTHNSLTNSVQGVGATGLRPSGFRGVDHTKC